MKFRQKLSYVFLIFTALLANGCGNLALGKEIQKYQYEKCKIIGYLNNASADGKQEEYFPKLEGKIIQTGKVKLVIVEFFHPKCGPCQESVEHLNQINKREDIKIIAASHVGEDSIKEFIEKFKPEYEIWQVPKDLIINLNVKYVPKVFIYQALDKKILWQGHPAKIDDELLDDIKQKN